jgi:hypothetical protein
MRLTRLEPLDESVLIMKRVLEDFDLTAERLDLGPVGPFRGEPAGGDGVVSGQQ